VPASSTNNTIARQWELLKMLPTRGPGLTSHEICDRLKDAGHEVSKRTVERDLKSLENIFALRCNDKSAPWGWSLPNDQAQALPGIALGEALTLRMVEDYIRPLVPAVMLEGLEARFSQARQKLQVLEEDNQSARWLNKVASVHPAMPTMPPQIDAQILETVQCALLEETQVACRYYSAHSDKTADHVLNPLGLVQRGQVTYLVATAAPHIDVRLYAVHRVLTAKQLKDACVVPTGFSLQGYVQSDAMAFGTPTPIKLKAWVTAKLARIIRETPLSADMQLVEDGEGQMLTATVNDTWQLRWWALSHAGSLVVMEPESLKQALLGQLEGAVGMYIAEEKVAERTG
jgi:predicted DNA-binding transcriptional regulator YafY